MMITSSDYPEYPSFSSSLDKGGAKIYKFKGKFNDDGEKNLSFSFNINKRLSETDFSNNEKNLSFFVYQDAEARDAFEINNFRAEARDMNSLFLKWETDVDTSATIFYKREDFSSYTEKTSSKKTEHSFFLEDLISGHGYDFKMKASHDSVTKDSDKIFFRMPKTNDLEFLDDPVLLKDEESKKVKIFFETNLYTEG